jgi:hypothetical protein
LTTGASRGDGDARLETTAASVIVGELEMLQIKAKKKSLDAPERMEMNGESEGEGGGFTASESMTSGGGTCELRR